MYIPEFWCGVAATIITEVIIAIAYSIYADHNRKGVQLASGQSVTVFKQILQNLGYNPVEAMENTINSERYDCITVE